MRAAAFVLLVALAPLGANAQPDTVRLEELTSPEVRDLVASGTTTIIIPVGGVEQSGPAMALGKHDARAQALSEAIARRLGHTLVAPVVAYVPEGSINPPTAHMRFTGTITVPAPAFRAILTSAAESFTAHGFKDIVLLGDHGGYQGDLSAVAADLDRRWAKTPARAHYIAAYYRAATAGFGATLAQRGYSAFEIGTHAGVADTSLMMAVDPRLVRADLLKSGQGLSAADGVYGDPRRSTAELGRIAVEAIVSETTSAIQAALRAPGHS